VKRDVINHFRSFGPDPFVMLQMANPFLTTDAERDALAFFSDVNSAVRRSSIKSVPFRDVAYAEDQALGRDLIAAGFAKAYAPLAAVTHSHSYPPRRYFARMYEEMRGLLETTGRTIDTSLPRHVAIVLRNTITDWLFIMRDPDYPALTKVKWLLEAPIYNLARRMAVRLARKPELPGWAAWAMEKKRAGRVAGEAAPAAKRT
jgi:rhamnosyltransferase